MTESYRLFTWDWKEQPPLAEILKSAQGMVDCGYPYFWYALPDTGGDYYACIVSERELSPEQIESILEGGRSR